MSKLAAGSSLRKPVDRFEATENSNIQKAFPSMVKENNLHPASPGSLLIVNKERMAVKVILLKSR